MIQLRYLGFASLKMARRVQKIEDRWDEAGDVTAAVDVAGEGGDVVEISRPDSLARRCADQYPQHLAF
jgi:hypothetical protein